MNDTICTVISNKDDGHLLIRRLQSIIDQTTPFDEIILIDDGSTDNSVDIINQFVTGNADLNIKTYFYNDTQGCNIRINNIIDTIESNFVFFGASDDYFLSKFVEEYKKIIKDFPFVKIITSVPTFDTNGEVQHEDININRCYICGLDVIVYMLGMNFWIPGHCSLLNIEAIKEFGGLKPEFEWHSDLFLNYCIAMQYGVVYTPLSVSIKTNNNKKSYASQGYRSEKQTVIKQLMLEEVKKPQYKDFYPLLAYYIYNLKG